MKAHNAYKGKLVEIQPDRDEQSEPQKDFAPVRDFTDKPANKYRSLFISDTHLYSKGCHYAELNRFLKHKHFEYIYLIGDIIDIWQLKGRKLTVHPDNIDDYSDDEDTDDPEEGDTGKSVNIIRRILKRKQRDNTRIFYIPGNHDDFFRNFIGLEVFGVYIAEEAIHTAVDGRRFLVMHGDRYDTIVRYNRWLSIFSTILYGWFIHLNDLLNYFTSLFRLKPWSLAKQIKSRIDGRLMLEANYEEQMASAGKKLGLDGIICGHSHVPAQKTIDDIEYFNCGDWLENCTAIIEHTDGHFELTGFDKNGKEKV